MKGESGAGCLFGALRGGSARALRGVKAPLYRRLFVDVVMSDCFCRFGVDRLKSYLAHKKTPTLLGPP